MLTFMQNNKRTEYLKSSLIMSTHIPLLQQYFQHAVCIMKQKYKNKDIFSDPWNDTLFLSPLGI
jgi:hypothetical protein